MKTHNKKVIPFKQILWLLIIWSASVCALFLVSLGIRFVMHLAGMRS